MGLFENVTSVIQASTQVAANFIGKALVDLSNPPVGFQVEPGVPPLPQNVLATQGLVVPIAPTADLSTALTTVEPGVTPASSFTAELGPFAIAYALLASAVMAKDAYEHYQTKQNDKAQAEAAAKLKEVFEEIEALVQAAQTEADESDREALDKLSSATKDAKDEAAKKIPALSKSPSEKAIIARLKKEGQRKVATDKAEARAQVAAEAIANSPEGSANATRAAEIGKEAAEAAQTRDLKRSEVYSWVIAAQEEAEEKAKEAAKKDSKTGVVSQLSEFIKAFLDTAGQFAGESSKGVGLDSGTIAQEAADTALAQKIAESKARSAARKASAKEKAIAEKAARNEQVGAEKTERKAITSDEKYSRDAIEAAAQKSVEKAIPAVSQSPSEQAIVARLTKKAADAKLDAARKIFVAKAQASAPKKATKKPESHDKKTSLVAKIMKLLNTGVENFIANVKAIASLTTKLASAINPFKPRTIKVVVNVPTNLGSAGKVVEKASPTSEASSKASTRILAPKVTDTQVPARAEATQSTPKAGK